MKAPGERRQKRAERIAAGEPARAPGRANGAGGAGSGKKRPNLDVKVVTKTARTLFRMANAGSAEGAATAGATAAAAEGGPEAEGQGAERKARWNAEKEQYLQQARRLLRALRKDGVELTMSKDAKDDESEVTRPLEADDEAPKGA